MRKYPKYKTVMKRYNELLEIVKDMETVGDLVRLGDECTLYFEVNGSDIDYAIDSGLVKLDTKISELEWFRVGSYKCLDLIYFYSNGEVLSDIWSKFHEVDFVYDADMKTLTKERYKGYIKNFELFL